MPKIYPVLCCNKRIKVKIVIALRLFAGKERFFYKSNTIVNVIINYINGISRFRTLYVQSVPKHIYSFKAVTICQYLFKNAFLEFGLTIIR